MKRIILIILCAVIALSMLAACSKAERPLTAAELLDLGEKYLLELNYEQALVQFLEVIEVEPRNPRGYTGAAEAYIGFGDADGAEAVLRKGLEALPNNAEIIDMAERLGIDVGTVQTSAPTPTPTDAPTPMPEPTATPAPAPTVGDIIEFGGYDWRVLDVQDNRILVISEMVLENQAYHVQDSGITWEYSDIRAYLNGEFLASFSADEQAQIAETRVENRDNPWFMNEEYNEGRKPYGGNDTTDRVFLLSLDEVVMYFGDSGDLANRRGWRWGADAPVQAEDGTWIDDQYNENRIAYHVGGTYYEDWSGSSGWHTVDVGASWSWWLRSPGSSSSSAAAVDGRGLLLVSAFNVSRTLGGVRPALWLALE